MFYCFTLSGLQQPATPQVPLLLSQLFNTGQSSRNLTFQHNIHYMHRVHAHSTYGNLRFRHNVTSQDPNANIHPASNSTTPVEELGEDTPPPRDSVTSPENEAPTPNKDESSSPVPDEESLPSTHNVASLHTVPLNSHFSKTPQEREVLLKHRRALFMKAAKTIYLQRNSSEKSGSTQSTSQKTNFFQIPGILEHFQGRNTASSSSNSDEVHHQMEHFTTLHQRPTPSDAPDERSPTEEEFFEDETD